MKRTSLLILIICCVSLLALIGAGCSGGTKSTKATAPEKPTTTPSGKSMSSIITNYAALSASDTAAAMEALRCAEDVNCGSCFKATQVKCDGGWARVSVREIDVPADESVAFDVYLRERDTGKWEVIQTGSDLTVDDIPGAPQGIFVD